VLRNLEQAGERTRTLSLIKSRGMKHSNQARELLLTDRGVELAEIVIGPDGGLLTGSARAAQEVADRAVAAALTQDITRKKTAMARKRTVSDARIAEMRAEAAAEAEDFDVAIAQQASTAATLLSSRTSLAGSRGEPAGGARPGRANASAA
jgi:circadian clock protein KaiC